MFDPKKYFTTARREFIETPLKEFGFKKYKTSQIARLTDGNVFQFLNFQKSAYGSEQFTINVTIRPLFAPNNDYLTLLPGNRLGDIAYGKDTWWNYSTEEAGQKNFTEILDLVQRFAFPFFNSTQSAKDIISTYEKNFWGKSKFGNKVSWGTSGWENYDFGHIYLMAGDSKNAVKQFDNSYKVFINDDRDWAQTAAKKCLDIKTIIISGQTSIDKYIADTIKESKQNLKLTEW